MAALEPQMRAAQSQSLLDVISSPLPLGWVSMTQHMKLSVSIRDALGSKKNPELWRDATEVLFNRPFFKGFVNMTTSIFGLKPSAS